MNFEDRLTQINRELWEGNCTQRKALHNVRELVEQAVAPHHVWLEVEVLHRCVWSGSCTFDQYCVGMRDLFRKHNLDLLKFHDQEQLAGLRLDVEELGRLFLLDDPRNGNSPSSTT
jgi:hypothetical protein